MNMSVLVRTPFYIAALAALVACGSDSSSGSAGISGKTIVGVTQKGPFVNGSSVTVQELNPKSLAQTGYSYEGKIKNDKGEFSVAVEQMSSPYALLKANGFFRNEVTGRKSSSQMTLYALSDLSERDEVNVNLLTHLEYERVMFLVTEKSMSLSDAKKQAKGEVLAAFGMENGEENPEDLNIFGSSDGDAALLAISVLMLGDLNEADFSERLANFAQDLETDGTWDSKITKAKIADWAYSSNFANIRTNILSWGLSDTVPKFEKMIVKYWTQVYGLEVCNEKNQGTIVSNKNYASAMVDVDFICHNGSWRSANSYDIDINGWKSGEDGEVKKAPSGTYYIYDKGEWREATTLEYDTYHLESGKDGDIKKGSVTDTYYIYNKGEWREATVHEANVYGFAKDTVDGAWKQGAIDKNLYYVYEKSEKQWREATTEKDYSSFNGCTDMRKLDTETIHYADEINDVYADTVYFCYNRVWYNNGKFYPELPQEVYFNPNIDYGELKDSRDGRIYKTVVIGSQTWMAENLRYVDSVQTPSLKGRVECELASSDYYTYYTANYSSSVGEIQSQCLENIGPFYAYPAIIDSVNIYKTYGLKCNQAKGCNLELPVRGICPEGWHVPSTDDWKVLASYAGLENDGSSFGFDKKSSPLMSRIGWFADRSNDDPYGFSAIIAGYDNGKMHGYQFAYYTTQKSEYMDLKHVRCLKD